MDNWLILAMIGTLCYGAVSGWIARVCWEQLRAEGEEDTREWLVGEVQELSVIADGGNPARRRETVR